MRRAGLAGLEVAAQWRALVAKVTKLHFHNSQTFSGWLSYYQFLNDSSPWR
jgi:hypothetical protein